VFLSQEMLNLFLNVSRMIRERSNHVFYVIIYDFLELFGSEKGFLLGDVDNSYSFYLFLKLLISF
jgi:hypothetical protein